LARSIQDVVRGKLKSISFYYNFSSHERVEESNHIDPLVRVFSLSLLFLRLRELIESSPATQMQEWPLRGSPPENPTHQDPTLPYQSIKRSHSFLLGSSDPDPHSATAYPPPPPLLVMRQPPASLLAGSIKRRSWPSAAARAGR
jgi:hypothetical protein